MSSRSRRWIHIFGWTAALLALLAILNYLRPPRSTLGWKVAFNLGHAPLFGVVSLVILQLLEGLSRGFANRRLLAYALALAFSALLGALDEAVQIFGARDSDPTDLFRDAIGAISFLLFAATFDRNALGRPSLSTRYRRFVRGGAVALLMVAFLPAFPVARAYALRADAFPRLCDFEAHWEDLFIAARGAELTRVPPPAGYERDPNHRVGLIHFGSARYPSFSLTEPYPDWTGYQTLRFDVISELDQTVILMLRIRDYKSKNRRGDRFSRQIPIQPGVNSIALALAEVRLGLEGREMDMSSIRSLVLSSRQTRKPFALFFDAFRLENP